MCNHHRSTIIAALLAAAMFVPAGVFAQVADSSNRFPAVVQGSGNISQVVITDPGLVPPPAGPAALSAPLQVYPLKGYLVSWMPVTNASQYTLTAGGTSVYSGAGLSKSFVASGTVGAKSAFQVQACGQYDCAPWSNQATTTVITPPAPPAPRVTAPSSVTVGDDFNVSWNAVSDPIGYAVSYQVQGHKDSAGDSTLYTGPGTTLRVTNAGPVNSHYYFSARACNPYACSGWGAATTGTAIGAATPPPPPVPGPMTVISDIAGLVVITPAPNATSYDVYMSCGMLPVHSGPTSTVPLSSLRPTGGGSYGFDYSVGIPDVQTCGFWSRQVNVRGRNESGYGPWASKIEFCSFGRC